MGFLLLQFPSLQRIIYLHEASVSSSAKWSSNTSLTTLVAPMRCPHSKAHSCYMRLLSKATSFFCFLFLWFCLSTTWCISSYQGHQHCVSGWESCTNNRQRHRTLNWWTLNHQRDEQKNPLGWGLKPLKPNWHFSVLTKGTWVGSVG